MVFTLPKLDYSYNALEPYIDSKTMEIHHTKHHQVYVDKLNLAVKETKFENMNINDILKNIKKVPENIRQQVINHGGGHSNHSFFWKIMTPNSEIEPIGEIYKEITKVFGSFEKFKEEFSNKALTVFGSGWAWLILDKGKLEIVQTKNQDSPLMENKFPILGIDMWEHSWYLKHMWNKGAYVKDWWNVINWRQVNENFKKQHSKLFK